MRGLIDRIAAEVGFSAVGVTTADPVEGLDRLREAIESDRLGSMRWLARNPELRCDPKSLLPGAKSVICCALSYGDGGIGNTNETGDFHCARFARGEDYHKVVVDKLEKIWGAIRCEAPNARAKICVDTSPILEKALAERAGLGWIGKHTILLNENLGSWFMLGEIITDLELKADEPSNNSCGECHACIDACPTGALCVPMKLDARRCISYLTLEHKGDIPGDICAYINTDTHGCDICQEACPYGGCGQLSR